MKPNLLLFFAADDNEVVNLVKIVSFAAIALLVVIVLILSTNKKLFDTRSMAFGAICIAMSFALSFIKIPMPFGGSVTLASFVPLLIYSYFFGPVKGLLAGIVYGLLQFIQEPYYYTPVQFILDYILAFSSLSLAGVFRKILGSKSSVIVGAATVGIVRLVMHVLSGLIFFDLGIVYPELPQDSALIYSLVYNLIYVIPDITIAIIAIIVMIYSGFYNRLGGLIEKTER